MKLGFIPTSQMTQGIYEGQVWEKTLNQKNAVNIIFYHSNKLDEGQIRTRVLKASREYAIYLYTCIF